MPNGHHLHDHPITDITSWNRRVFSLEMDTLLAEIWLLGEDSDEELPEVLADRLFMADPRFRDDVPADVLAQLEADVQVLRDQRVASARARGSDPDDLLKPIRAKVRDLWLERD